MVTFIGAGPGAADLITLRGAAALQRADIVIYAGSLVNPELLEHCPDQYFAVLTDTRTVGVMGDARTYGYTAALRAVSTDDFMTADWSRLPYEVLERAGSRIINEVPGISRVVYDISSKPPSTVEWE